MAGLFFELDGSAAAAPVIGVSSAAIGFGVLCQIADELGAKGADRAMLSSALAVGLTALLSLLVLRAKGHLHDVGYLLVTMLGMAGALAGGGLIVGLMFVAFLTTQPAAAPLVVETREAPAGATY